MSHGDVAHIWQPYVIVLLKYSAVYGSLVLVVVIAHLCPKPAVGLWYYGDAAVLAAHIPVINVNLNRCL